MVWTLGRPKGGIGLLTVGIGRGVGMVITGTVKDIDESAARCTSDISRTCAIARVFPESSHA
jgi:hypothetical protein